MNIGPLYHWSPVARRASIKDRGLVAGQLPTVSSHGERQLCLATDPARAWKISGAMDWVDNIDEWDLWMVYLSENDAVHVNAFYGDAIEEVRVDGPIPPNRLWYVGRREA